jgi:hypothetical protein
LDDIESYSGGRNNYFSQILPKFNIKYPNYQSLSKSCKAALTTKKSLQKAKSPKYPPSSTKLVVFQDSF